MIRKLLWAVLILLLTLNSVYALEDGVTIPLVADRSADGGDEGVLLGAQVIVTNGTGHVFVDTNPYTQVDLQGSARLAAMVASDVLGIDERAYDFYYIIDISSPIIGGPSAGGALTVATIAAINKWTLKPDVVMTGMINPDETIGPVGGIPYKLEAAAAKNATLFLIPQGQSTVTVKKTSSGVKGPFIVSELKDETVDVVELGKKLNVTVKEVSTIQEAVLAFTGNEISKPTYNGTILTSDYLGLLEPLATRLKNESSNMYESTTALVQDDQFLKQAKDIESQADNMYNDKKYYAATSLYFRSMINIRTAQWNYGYGKAANKEQYLAELTNRVEKQIQSSEKDLDNFKKFGVTDVGAVGAAESRITEAKARLDDSKNLNDSADKEIPSLAFANERARTAQWWLMLAKSDGRIIPETILKDRAGWYLSQAQSINTYMQTLLTESGPHPGDIVGTEDSINLTQIEMQRGYYSGAIMDSLQISVRASTTIGMLGQIDTDKKIEQSADAAETAINDARMQGVEPTLAVSAYEYADTLTEPFDKINQYAYAKMVARTSVVLNSHTVSTNRTPVKPELTPFTAETILPTPATTATGQKVRVPAFEAITALAIILLAGRLRKR